VPWDKNQIEAITNVDFSQFLNLTVKNVDAEVKKLANFEELNETSYCQEIKVVGKRRYILCFNPQLFKDQQNAREDSLTDFKEYLKATNEELLKAQKTRNLKSTKR